MDFKFKKGLSIEELEERHEMSVLGLILEDTCRCCIPDNKCGTDIA